METVSRHDAGLYSCIASNIIGEGDRVDIEIDVHCKLPDLLLILLLASLSLCLCMARLTSVLPRPGGCCCHQHRPGPVNNETS